MPVLIRLTTNFRPGNSVRATAVPQEIPTKRLIIVAGPDTWSERNVMPITSGSRVTRS